MLGIKPKTRRLILVLVLIAVLGIFFYLFPSNGSLSSYLINSRLKKLFIYLLVAIMTSFSTISFQTMTGNRFLTPAILGIENLYVFMQSLYLYFAWQITRTQSPNALLEFIVVLGIQLTFYALLQPFMNRLLKQGFGRILLICMAIGMFLRSFSTYIQVLMDPNEYDKLQSKLFASLQSANTDVIWIVAIISLVIVVFFYRHASKLDILYLGKENAMLLGLDVDVLQKRVLWLVVILTSLSTAMIGPTAFLGFLVTNISYQITQNYQHRYLYLTTSLLAFVIILVGQTILERILHYSITIAMLVELLGGIFFFYLLYKERIKT